MKTQKNFGQYYNTNTGVPECIKISSFARYRHQNLFVYILIQPSTMPAHFGLISLCKYKYESTLQRFSCVHQHIVYTFIHYNNQIIIKAL